MNLLAITRIGIFANRNWFCGWLLNIFKKHKNYSYESFTDFISLFVVGYFVLIGKMMITYMAIYVMQEDIYQLN